jgi:hypothetical protein
MAFHRSASIIAAGLSVLGMFAQNTVAFDASANDNVSPVIPVTCWYLVFLMSL